MDNKRVYNIFCENVSLHEKVLNNSDFINQVVQSARICCDALQKGNKILICGNGGSAADAQHMAAELVGRFQKERKGIAAIALNTDTSILTAWANDYNYESIFCRQVEALGNKDDVLIGISTSGNSENVLKAFKFAKSNAIKTVSLLGNNGGKIKSLSDKAIIVPSSCTARIQEVHITVIHTICEIIEDTLI